MKIIKIRYSIEPRDRIYVKGYEFLPFAKNMGKKLSNTYDQKLLDSAKKSITDAIKTASEIAVQITAEATGDLIGNKIADQITSVSKKFNANIETEAGVASPKDVNKVSPNDVPKKRYIFPEERQQITDELRLV